jgi:hypothetical protein
MRQRTGLVVDVRVVTSERFGSCDRAPVQPISRAASIPSTIAFIRW